MELIYIRKFSIHFQFSNQLHQLPPHSHFSKMTISFHNIKTTALLSLIVPAIVSAHLINTQAAIESSKTCKGDGSDNDCANGFDCYGIPNSPEHVCLQIIECETNGSVCGGNGSCIRWNDNSSDFTCNCNPNWSGIQCTDQVTTPPAATTPPAVTPAVTTTPDVTTPPVISIAKVGIGYSEQAPQNGANSWKVEDTSFNTHPLVFGILGFAIVVFLTVLVIKKAKSRRKQESARKEQEMAYSASVGFEIENRLSSLPPSMSSP